MKKGTKIILITVALGVIVVFIVLLSIFSGDGEERHLIAVPGLPQSEWLRVVTTNEVGVDLTLAVNQFDGYNITVPAAWYVAERASRTGGTKISYEPGVDPSEYASGGIGEVINGLLLSVVTFENPDNLSLTDWVTRSEGGKMFFPDAEIQKFSHSVGIAYRTPRERIFEEGFLDEDSAITRYFFGGNNKIYVVTCLALGDRFEEFISQCEKQVQTFTILNKDPLSEFFPYGGDGFEIDFNDADSNAGDSTYRVVLKPTLGLGADGFEKEIDAIVERVNNWIITKEVNPKNLSIEWVME